MLIRGNGSSEVHINKRCVIVVLVAHGAHNMVHGFRFREPCTAGTFVGCDAGMTNELIQILPPSGGPGFPKHDIPGALMDRLIDLSRGTGINDDESEAHWVARMRELARHKAQEFCDKSDECCCPNNEVTIVETGSPADGGWERATKTERYPCQL